MSDIADAIDRQTKAIMKIARRAEIFYGAFWVIFIITILVLYWKVFL